MNTAYRHRAGRAGFTLIELMIAMAVVLIVMAGTMSALMNAYRANENARSVIDVNNNLRIGADLIVRDFIQVGQGLPPARVVQVPNGTGSLRIQRPHAQGITAAACVEWPTGTTTIPAVNPGPGCGPTINGVGTDSVTTVAVDSTIDLAPILSFNLTNHTATVATAAQSTGGLDISTGTGDDVRVGDLMMFTKGSVSALVYVTAVDGNQTFTFGTGDPMNLNQFLVAYNGTLDDLATTPTCSALLVGSSCDPTKGATVTAYSSFVSRVRMITYYLDTTIDPTTPRLIRHMNWGDPAVALNLRGRTVAFAIDRFIVSYDMVDTVNNFSNVRMVAADLASGGACGSSPCSPNQIRKVNLSISGRSTEVSSVTKQYVRNSLATQVSLRSLALVDRYR
jgi:prepilin-type N-terminal cleavage/methylation domain-containing protein